MIWFSLKLPVLNKCIKMCSHFDFIESVNQLQSLGGRNQSSDHVVQIIFVLFVLQLLLIMGGLETSPGPH